MKEKYVFLKSKLGISSFILFIVGFILFMAGEIYYGVSEGGFEIIGTIIIAFIGSIIFIIILSLFLTSVRSIIPYILLAIPYLVACAIRLDEMSPYFDEVFAMIGLISGCILLTAFVVTFIIFSRKQKISVEDATSITEDSEKIVISPIESKKFPIDTIIHISTLIIMLSTYLIFWIGYAPYYLLYLIPVILFLGGHIFSLLYVKENYNWNFSLISSILSVIIFAFTAHQLIINYTIVLRPLVYGIGLGSLIIGNSVILVIGFKRTVKAKTTDIVEEKDTEKILAE